MDRREILFQRFIKINEFSRALDFTAGCITYSGLGYTGQTKEQLCGTPEFAGFIDGIEGKISKYEGPRGLAQPKQRRTGLVRSLEDIALRIESKNPSMSESLLGALERLESQTERARYSTQYRTGQSCKGSA